MALSPDFIKKAVQEQKKYNMIEASYFINMKQEKDAWENYKQLKTRCHTSATEGGKMYYKAVMEKDPEKKNDWKKKANGNFAFSYQCRCMCDWLWVNLGKEADTSHSKFLDLTKAFSKASTSYHLVTDAELQKMSKVAETSWN
eukprot:TRINITY_DN12112_c0_g1_i1.p1 TRINITY_DN12112_c0_g1~~TRINITY_DN12112_c0_g1_i1.p1  ORF type:complete len:143 (-),score=30.58 TRINITY_DN12112_c0_g1_i1:73-501(-)